MCRTAFSPEYGLFSANSDNRMYPFPGAFAMHPDAEKLFRFLGKAELDLCFKKNEISETVRVDFQVVGKAIYEMMLLEPQFSRAFLNRVLGRESDIEEWFQFPKVSHGGWLQDVASVDRDLHRGMWQTSALSALDTTLASIFDWSLCQFDGSWDQIAEDNIRTSRTTSPSFSQIVSSERM